MSTKFSNYHILRIIEDSKSYNTLNTYIILAHVSSEVKDKYLIHLETNHKCDLANVVKKYVTYSYKTIYNNLEELEELGILKYDDTLDSWVLMHMENMTKSKYADDIDPDYIETFSGYTSIRNFFLSPDFMNMKAREKRLILYASILADSKSSDKYKGEFIINLKKTNSKWLKILKTKCKYYARKTMIAFLKTYSYILTDKSDDLRADDFSPEKNKKFKFAFTSDTIKRKNTDNDFFDEITLKNPNEYKLIQSKMEFSKVSLSKQKVMHLIRAICNLKEWFLKERVVQLIINKYDAIQNYKSREDIKSLPAYAAAVVKAVTDEYKHSKEVYEQNKLNAALINK